MIKLSPSSLNLFLDCPRCFWLYVNKNIKQPGGPVATITTGIDRVVKEYFNLCRSQNVLPLFLQGKISGRLANNLPKNGWLEFIDNKYDARLGGYLDECIKLENNCYAVLDHKTRGSRPDAIHKAYQLQMDAYTFLLEKNNLPTQKTAYIVYYIPLKTASGTDFQFEALVKELKTDPQRAEEVFYRALEVLHKPIPALSENCDFCQWTATINIK
jgi:hypothetical protein